MVLSTFVDENRMFSRPLLNMHFLIRNKYEIYHSNFLHIVENFSHRLPQRGDAVYTTKALKHFTHHLRNINSGFFSVSFCRKFLF